MTNLDDISVERARVGAHALSFERQRVYLSMLRDGADTLTFANGAEFREKGLQTIEVPCRVYSFEGCLVPVIVPEDYAAQLDEVRELRRRLQAAPAGEESDEWRRWAAHPLAVRALPEDVFAVVEALPTKITVSRVIFRGDTNPCDLYYKTLYGDHFRSAADVEWGEVAFYASDLDHYFTETLFHEWAHTTTEGGHCRQLRRLFDKAIALEPDGDYSRPYASQPGEALAVNLGEQVMGFSGAAALEFAKNAPIRAAVLSRGLRQLLQSGLDMLEPSSLLDAFLRRLDVIDRETGVAARARLVDTANHSSDRNLAHDAAVLLAFVGTADDTAVLTKSEILDLSAIPLDIDAMERIGRMPAVRSLQLNWTDLDGDWLRSLATMPLEYLMVEGVKLCNYHLFPLLRVKSLRFLNLAGTLVNDGAVEILSRIPLRYLDTRRTRMTDEGRDRLRELTPNLHVE